MQQGMRFADVELQTALKGWRALADPIERAEADNLWFEERVSTERQQTFENYAIGSSGSGELKRRQTDYWQEYVRVDDDIPHTFNATLAPADLGPIDETQKIVRLEDLT